MLLFQRANILYLPVYQAGKAGEIRGQVSLPPLPSFHGAGAEGAGTGGGD